MSPELKEKIVEELKAKGLENAEHALTDVAEIIFKYYPEIASESKTKVDDICIPLVAVIKGPVMESLGKIHK